MFMQMNYGRNWSDFQRETKTYQTDYLAETTTRYIARCASSVQ